jgi:hypothetical protein
MTDNVVPFPGVKRNTPPQNLEEVQSNLEIIRQVHIEEAMNLVATVVFDNLSLAGFSFDPDDDSTIKDVALMLESLRSLLSKYHGLGHPLHRVANEIFALQKNGTVICLESKLEKLCEEEKV